MLRLFVLLTAVVCCYACTLRMDGHRDVTNGPDCTDSDENIHKFDSEWQTESETCVCAHKGIICCPRFGDRFGSTFPPEPIPESTTESTTESTPKIYYDDFGAFTENDFGESLKEPSISDEEPATPEVSNQLDSSDSPEVIAGDSHESAEDSE